ncbi:phage portal protein [Paenibacillus wulumuqiensis]|uniref:portal protein n=1 Tax=Paenibacillus wulumuqiensis TaxID=1567107 RepID=UPI00061A0A74|nr:portal protein [Paenibacillus wulumuqiensis]
MTEFYNIKEKKLFYPGAAYPPDVEIPRLAKYERGRTIFEGRHAEIYDRASSLLKDSPHASQLKTLFIAVNLMDLLLTKPADLMVGEAPSYSSGKDHGSVVQERVDSIAEENDLTQLIHEAVVGAGIRGDSFIKTYYAPRADISETLELGLTPPPQDLEPIIEPVDPSIVFPELSRGSKKRFKAINIAWVEWEIERTDMITSLFTRGLQYTDKPYLNVERHIPGYIIYERYELFNSGVDTSYDVPISTYKIGEQVATGRHQDIVPTGTSRLLIDHIPYKTTDEHWSGISGIEKVESVLSAINERLVQIDYILWKHADPTAYGPDIDDGDTARWGGKYIPLESNDVTPGYMVWEGQLESAFRELDLLLGIVYQMSETPQWLFGTTLASDKGGTGTSHTDVGAIKARFMPILSKVKRIRTHVDRALRDALYKAQELELFANQGVEGFEPYEAVYPKIEWRDGLPRDDKEAAEVAQIRTGGKATQSVMDAIKEMDGLSDAQAAEMLRRITEDDDRTLGTVDASIFNEEDPVDESDQ